MLVSRGMREETAMLGSCEAVRWSVHVPGRSCFGSAENAELSKHQLRHGVLLAVEGVYSMNLSCLTISLTGLGGGQLSGLVRKSAVHSIHETRPGNFTARPATSDFSPLQGSLDPLLDIRLSVLFDYPCACVRMGKLGIQRVYRHHLWTSLVRAPLTSSSHGD